MTLLERFLDPESVSLKICGVTCRSDADMLVDSGVDAIGVNFWPKSKRYLPAEEALWLHDLAGKILRVGVFVNEKPELPLRLMRQGLLDAIQLHGDEKPGDVMIYREAGIPFIKAIGVGTPADLADASDFHAASILLDAHAPGVYGGTGETFDWDAALAFKKLHPDLPIVLAGGITVSNAALAAATVRPSALDVASGAETEPGAKDFNKVTALLAALHR